MDKVIILGIYNFLGFGTCMKLLEDGIQVLGYRFIEEEREHYVDEKKFLIGRNANFIEGTLMDPPILELDDSEVVILISYYDLYYLIKEEDLSIQKFQLNTFIKSLQLQSILKIVCLFPYEFLNGIPAIFQQQINLLKSKNISIQSIFLPTIYGPWQPDIFLFQQFFISDYSNIQPKLDLREDTTDAIYIDDAIEEIIQLLHKNDMESVVIQNEEDGNWLKCAQYLKLESIDSNVIEKIVNPTFNVQIRKLNAKTPLHVGLAKQKQHLSRLKNHSN